MKAIIFDLDGVLLSTDILHRDALMHSINIILGKELIDVSAKSMYSTSEKIKSLQKEYKFDDDISADIYHLKDSIFLIKAKYLVPLPNVLGTLQYIKFKGIKTAIASNSRLINIHKVLEITKLGQYFDVIVSAEEVNQRKPAPDILYEVYKRLEIDGKNTLFVEDTDEGAQAGYNSPSTVIRVNSPEDLSINLFKDWIEQCTVIKN